MPVPWMVWVTVKSALRQRPRVFDPQESCGSAVKVIASLSVVVAWRLGRGRCYEVLELQVFQARNFTQKRGGHDDGVFFRFFRYFRSYRCHIVILYIHVCTIFSVTFF